MPTPVNALNISSPGIVVFDGSASFSEISPAASSVLVTSAGSVPSLSQTLPSAVQANITSVGTIASGTWNGSVISGQYGGTGVANTGKTVTLGGSLTTSGAFDSTFTMTGATSITFPTSGTLATTSSIPSLPLSLANGGTAASLTASNGGIVYSGASAFAVLSGTATANQVLLSGSSTTPAWSTATYPSTTTVNQLLYSSSGNVIAGLATGNNGVLITSAGGVPSISSTLPSAVQGNITSVGTIASGTWNGSAIDATHGGTAQTSWTTGDLLYASGANTLAKLAIGTAGQILTVSAGLPAWSAAVSGITTLNGSSGSATGSTVTLSPGTTGLTYTGSGATMTTAGTLVLANGGSGASLTASTGGIIYSGASAMAVLAGTATAGQILRSGASAAPSWSTATYPATAGTSGNILQSDGTNFTSVAFPTRVTTINGDSGSATGATITLTGATSNLAGASVRFTGSGSTVSLALSNNNNIFLGTSAGSGTFTGSANAGIGNNCFAAVGAASDNASCGASTLRSLTTGSSNCAMGSGCFQNLLTGNFNIGIGLVAGQAYNAAESSNIVINPYTTASAGESNVLRIGAGTGTGTCQINKAIVSGIYGITTASATTSTVLVSDGNQLGTIASSARFKKDINDMGDVSEKIMKMRPVTFHYKAHKDNVLQYGLIAEEVMEIMPEIVNLDDEGKPFTVRYHDLPCMMLNEMQKMMRRIEELESKLASRG